MMSNHFADWWGIYALFGALAILLAILIPVFNHQQNEWEGWCATQGGHVTSNDSVVVAGKNVGVSTTYYCLTDDGRLLGVR